MPIRGRSPSGCARDQRITVSEALRALMVQQRQRRCTSRSRTRSAGSERRFAVLMNQLRTAHSASPTRTSSTRAACPRPGSTCRRADLATLSRYAMARLPLPQLRRHPGRGHPLAAGARPSPCTNHNRLLCSRGPTASRPARPRRTGMVLAAAGQPGARAADRRHDARARRATQEVQDALELFAWGSAQYDRRPVVAVDAAVTSRPGPNRTVVTLAAASSLSAVVRRGAVVTRRFDVPRSFTSAPSVGADAGGVTYLSDGLTLGTVRLLVAGVGSPSPSPSP